MAVATDSTPAPARTLLRSGGAPCRVLTTADVLAILSGRPARPASSAAVSALAALSAAVDRAGAGRAHKARGTSTMTAASLAAFLAFEVRP